MLATGDSCPLPEDLIIEILLRLPVKSLLCFRSVCHLWNTAIRSRSFIQNHYRGESNFTGLLVYWSGEVRRNRPGRALDFGENFIFDPISTFSLVPDGTLGRYEGLDHTNQVLGLVFSLRGPCNGIFCVRDCDKLALWNPATRSLRRLPDCLNIFGCDIGFGIDPLTDEFTVVLIKEVPGSDQFAIYKSNCNSWRYLQDEALTELCSSEVNNFGPTFSDGHLYYWIRLNMRTSKYVILAYDMHKEIFQEIESPKILEENVERKLDWYGDSLALLAYRRSVIDLWLMKEQGCWTKMLSVCLPFGDFVSVGIWKENQIFASTFGSKLILCDLNSPNRKNLEFQCTEDATTFDLYGYKYKESLVSV